MLHQVGFFFQLANLQYIASINTDHLFCMFLINVASEYFSKYSSQANFQARFFCKSLCNKAQALPDD